MYLQIASVACVLFQNIIMCSFTQYLPSNETQFSEITLPSYFPINYHLLTEFQDSAHVLHTAEVTRP